MSRVQLVQLPLHPGTAWEPTGNIPLAPAKLAAAAGLSKDSVFPEHLLNSLGDQGVLEELHSRNPAVIAVTLYLWNRHRTLNLIQQYKKAHPGVLVVAGGPEVTADNSVLLAHDCIDLFVAGEGEIHAEDVLHVKTLKEIIKTGQKLLGPFRDTSSPDRWPDPYETGHITPAPGGSAHVETQRGCGCLCSYCAYRRTAPVPRVMPAEAALSRIRLLKEKGAEELVFLDPTFNARNDLTALLSGMEPLGMASFAEVRGDLIKPDDGVLFKKAGFHSLEVGLQTMSREVLKAVGRGGNPEKILWGAEILRNSGITPVIDLILGLPGDNPENIVKAAQQITARDLEEQVQTFCLSVLPGTELRANAVSLGIKYNDYPPYCLTQSGSFTLQNLMEKREQVSDILGYDADPPPRPVLCRSFPKMEIFIPEAGGSSSPESVRHGVLRIRTEDAWVHREAVMKRILLRRETDPYCPLDIVIESEEQFPLDLLDMINSLQEPDCYDREKSEIYNVPSLIRTAVIAKPSADPGWLQECSTLATTVIKSKNPVALPGGEVGLLLAGSFDLTTLSALYSQAPHLVFFTNPELEKLWNLDILGLG